MSATINLDIAKRVDIVCRKGDTATFSITITDSNGNASTLTGYTFNMEVRESDSQVNDGITNTSALVLSSLDGIVVASNVITITASSTKTQELSGLYVYDFQAKETSSSNVSTWLYGTFKVNEDVTI